MDSKMLENLMFGNLVNNTMAQANAANQYFIQATGQSLQVHARCGQVLDKRVSELDIAEGRGHSAIDPVSKGYHIASDGIITGAGHVNTGLLTAILDRVTKSN